MKQREKKNFKKWGQPQRPLGQCQMPQHLNYRNPRRRRQKERPWENRVEEIIVENFPKMGKEIATQVQETQRVPNRINPRWSTPRHILIKLMKIKHKEQILKAVKEKQQITHKGIPIRITVDLSTETLQVRREWQDIKWWKKITYSPDYCTQQESHSNIKQKSKALQTSKSWENSAPPNQLSNKC